MTNLLLAIVFSASIDSTQMVMGEQTRMHVEMTCDADAPVALPDFELQMPMGVEVVKAGTIDTVKRNDGQVQVSQDLTLTSFRDTVYTLQPYVATITGDTVRAERMQLEITRPEGIEQMQDMNDIKDIEYVPIWWWDVTKWILLGFGIVLLCVGGYFLYLLLEKNRKPEQAPAVPLRPADEVALEKLDIIKAEKIWQAGKVKEYHTELTDVVREYIGRRFEVHSTEKTSDETLREMKPLIDRDLYGRLSKMLQLADLVKFAKWETTPEENEMALTTAYDFVNETKIVNDENDGNDVNDEKV